MSKMLHADEIFGAGRCRPNRRSRPNRDHVSVMTT